MVRGKRESGVARGADLWTKGGDYNAHFRDRRPFAFGSREKGKLDRRGEEGELRNKKAAASHFKLFCHWYKREWTLHWKTEAWRPEDGSSGLL